MNNFHITKVSTLFLRIASSVVVLIILALCVFLLPTVWSSAYVEYPSYGYIVQIITAAMYLTVVPFFFGIYQGWKILGAIDKGHVFSKNVVSSLGAITRYAGFISFVYVLMLPFFYIWADNDDAPGLMAIGLFLIGMPLIISVTMGLLQRLLGEAVKIKSENDLTV